MLRQVGIGTSLVLSVGLLAVGCSQDGDTITAGGGGTVGDLFNQDNLSLSSVNENNLAPDGGGLSPNSAGLGEFQIVWNCDNPSSDGTFAGDGTAMLLFEINGAQSRVYASHWDNGFTPPTELLGEDRNYGVGTLLSSYVCIPLNTSGYTTTTAANNDKANQTRSHNGYWLILGEYTTLYNDPARTSKTKGQGPRRVVGSWVFAKDKRATASATLSIGGSTRLLRYGFQETSEIVSAALTSGGHTAAAGNPTFGNTAGFEATTAIVQDVPPCHVTSYGAMSDGFCGESRFGGNALPFMDAAPGNGAAWTLSGLNDGSVDTSFTAALPQVGTTDGDPYAVNVANLAALQNASYSVGEATTFIRCFFTQVANSLELGNGVAVNRLAITNSNGNQTFAGGHELQLRTRGFDMATLSWGTEEQVDGSKSGNLSGPTVRNPNGTATLQCGTAPFPEFRTYNNALFYKYADASLVVNSAGGPVSQFTLGLAHDAMDGNGPNWAQDERGGHNNGQTIGVAGFRGFWEEIIASVLFSDNTDGTNSPVSGSHRDTSTDQLTDTAASGTESNGAHSLDNPTIGGTASNVVRRDTYPADREMANFNGGNSQSIFGSDEGLAELTFFYVMSDGSNTAAGTGHATTTAGGDAANVDRQLLVTVLSSSTGKLVTPAGINPLRISGVHKEDWLGGAGDGGQSGSDPRQGNAIRIDSTSLEDPIVPRGFRNGLGGVRTAGAAFNHAGYPDPDFFQTCVNRTGEYVAIAFLKDTGVSVKTGAAAGGFAQALFVTAFQFLRTGSTVATNILTNVEKRVPTGGPVQISGTIAPTAPGGKTLFVDKTTAGASGAGFVDDDSNARGQDDRAENFWQWTSTPVNDYSWQGKSGYRLGWQSDRTLLSILYEQSDATEDRVFVRQIKIDPGKTTAGTPDMTVQGTASIEIDGTAEVKTAASFIDIANNGTTFQGTATVRFLDTSVVLSGDGLRGQRGTNANGARQNFFSCDIGLDSTGAGGDIVIFYEKVIDNTVTTADQRTESGNRGQLFTGDSDRQDAVVRAVRWDGAALTAAVTMDRGISARTLGSNGAISNQVTYVEGGGTAPDVAGANDGTTPNNTHGDPTTGPDSRGRFGTQNNTNTQILGFVATPNNTDIVNAKNYPTTGRIRVIGIMGDSEGTEVTTGTTVTITGNAGDRQGMFVRSVENFTATVTAFADTFTPSVKGTKEQVVPTQIDHVQGSFTNSALVSTTQAGTAVAVVMQTDNQLFVNLSVNGTLWLIDANGQSNPALITNASSSDVNARSVTSCQDADGDDLKVAILFSKNDKNQTNRLHARMGGY